jgi:hypothetical protein
MGVLPGIHFPSDLWTPHFLPWWTTRGEFANRAAIGLYALLLIAACIQQQPSKTKF